MKSKRILTIVALVSTLTMPLSVFAADGDLDLTYGTNGLARTFETGLEGAVDVAMQNDKSIVLAPMYDDFAVLRFNSDGTRDMTFGTGGKTVIDFKGSHSSIETDDIPYAVTVQADGKILVVGSTAPLPLGKARNFAVARVNRNGGLDTTFGAGGIVVTDFFGEPDTAYDVIEQVDNKIVVVGEADLNQNTKFGIARYNSNGSPDTSFANAGIKTVGWGYGYNVAYSVAQQSDGKLVVVGVAQTPNYDFAIARLRVNGTLDPGFGSSGLVSTAFSWGYGTAYSQARSVAIASDGKIVVGGATYASTVSYFVGRYLTDGSLDPSFGNGGKVFTYYFGATATTISISSGRIILVGWAALNDGCSYYSHRYNAILIGYNDDGSLDSTFGISGIVSYNPYPADLSYCQSGMIIGGSALQSDGKLVVAGADYLYNSYVGVIAARFEN